MSLALFRIDERLLHGQVIVGWGMRLGLEHYVIVDDALSGSDWEQELYAAGLPEGVTVDFVGVREAVERFQEMDARPMRSAVLTRTTRAMRELAEAGCLAGRRVNVGGLHASEGRRQAVPYVSLRPEEADDLRVIRDACRRITARDLPMAPEVEIGELLNAVD